MSLPLPAGPRGAWERWLGGAVLGVVVALVLLGPSLGVGGQPLLGHENLDNWSHAWGMDWFLSELAAGRIPWEITGAAFPERRVLWYVDPVGALLVSPVWALAGPVWAYTVLQLVQVALAAFSGWLFGRALGGRGWLAGAAIATTPLLQTEIWNGVLEACWIAPVALAGALAARRSPWTGVVTGLAAVATPYHGLGAVLLVTTLLLMGGTRTGRRLSGRGRPGLAGRLADLGLAGVLTAALAVPHSMLLAASFDTGEPFVQRPLFSGFDEPSMRINAVDPLALVHPGDFWSVQANLTDPLSPPWLHSPYLGLLCLGLGLLAWVRWPRLLPLLVPVVVAVVASLGHFLFHDGDWVMTPQGGRYLLPVGWINTTLEVTFQHHLRFIGVAVVTLAALADRSAGRLGLLLVPAVLVEHLVLAPNAWPLASVDATPPPVYERIPDDGRAIVDLPADAGEGNRTNRFLLWQAFHGHPVPWVNKVSGMGTASMHDTLRHWTWLSRTAPRAVGAPGVPDPNADHVAGVQQLAEMGFGWVILHPDVLAHGHEEEVYLRELSAVLGPPEQVPSGEYVWELPAP